MIDKIIKIMISNDSQAKELGCQLLVGYLMENYNSNYDIIFRIRDIVSVLTGCFQFQIPNEIEVEELVNVNYQYPFEFEFGNISMRTTYIQYQRSSTRPKIRKTPEILK